MSSTCDVLLFLAEGTDKFFPFLQYKHANKNMCNGFDFGKQKNDFETSYFNGFFKQI